jgi:hypothetical protein
LRTSINLFTRTYVKGGHESKGRGFETQPLTETSTTEENKICLWEVESDRYMRLYMSRLSRQCAILNISQPYSQERAVKGIAFRFACNYRKNGILNARYTSQAANVSAGDTQVIFVQNEM